MPKVSEIVDGIPVVVRSVKKKFHEENRLGELKVRSLFLGST